MKKLLAVLMLTTAMATPAMATDANKIEAVANVFLYVANCSSKSAVSPSMKLFLDAAEKHHQKEIEVVGLKIQAELLMADVDSDATMKRWCEGMKPAFVKFDEAVSKTTLPDVMGRYLP